MAVTLLMLAILLFGLTLVVIGVVLLFVKKNKLAGLIVGLIGALTTLSSIAGFLALVITTRTMG